MSLKPSFRNNAHKTPAPPPLPYHTQLELLVIQPKQSEKIQLLIAAIRIIEKHSLQGLNPDLTNGLREIVTQ